MDELITMEKSESFESQAASSTSISDIQSQYNSVRGGLIGHSARDSFGARRTSYPTGLIRSYDGAASVPLTRYQWGDRTTSTESKGNRGRGQQREREQERERGRMKRLAKHRHRLLPHYIGFVFLVEIFVIFVTNRPFG